MNDESLEAIRRAALAELERAPKARPWWVDAVALVAVNALCGLGWSTLFAFNLVQHTGPVLRGLGAAGLGLMALGGAVAAVRPGGRPLRVLSLGVFVATVLVMLWGASGFDPGTPFFGGVGCGLSELTASVVPAGVSLWVLSRFAPDAVRTLVAGLAAGAGGLLTLHLHCPNGTLAHLLVFHLAPWVLVSLVAVGLRRKLPSASWAP
jgi:hypothetical protein